VQARAVRGRAVSRKRSAQRAERAEQRVGRTESRQLAVGRGRTERASSIPAQAQRCRAPAALALLALLGLAGCRTLPAAERELSADDPRVGVRVAALRELAAGRTALRANARARSEGPDGGGFSSQLLLAQRPASLRVEVIGLLQQRVLVLATDGERYELYRAEGGLREAGPVHPGVLEEVAGLPVTPEAAVGLLLAAPRAPDGPPLRASENGAGELALHWAEETLAFDAEGRLAALHFRPDGRDVLRARWSDWRETPRGAFPHRLDVELPESEARLALEFRQVELDPVLAPELFRLGLGGS
jgi:hypothetical protein